MAAIIYMIARNLFVMKNTVNWLCRVNNISESCGRSYLWFNQSSIHSKQSKQILHKLVDIGS